MPYQLVSLYYISHQTYLVPRPCNPRVILSEAAPPAENHARPPNIAAQSNPAPSGAPAGGISVAERHHTTLRTHPFVRVAGGRNASRGTFKQRRSRLLAPPGGAPAGGISVAKRHHITPRTTPKSLPPVGGRKTARSLARQRRMRAKQANADA